MKTPHLHTNSSGYPACVNGPANLKSPADAASPGGSAYYVEETSFFPYSCASSNDCTGMKNHPVPFEHVEDEPYRELYPYLPPKL